MKEQQTVISVQNVSKTYTVHEYDTGSIRKKIWSIFTGNSSRKIKALSDINFEVKKGEFFGIIGHNGSGKSTLINLIAKAIKPDAGGVVERDGKYIRLSLGMGFNPNLSARQNVMLNGTILGIPRKEIDERVPEIIEFAGLTQFTNTQIKYFSSGMKARLAFAVAVLAEAEIFLMDEFFGGVGDQFFKQKANEVFQENLVKGRTVVHVSHSMNNIEKYCDRVLVLNNGEMLGIFEPKEAVERYQSLLGKKNHSKQ